MELVYLWVEDYKNIKKQGFNFSPRFKCEYDDEKKELTINEKKEYVNIFPDNINVTAIVGENGSGKTTLLKFIVQIVNNRHFNVNSFFAIFYEIIDDSIVFYKQEEKMKIKNNYQRFFDNGIESNWINYNYKYEEINTIIGKHSRFNAIGPNYTFKHIHIVNKHKKILMKIDDKYNFDTLQLVIKEKDASFIDEVDFQGQKYFDEEVKKVVKNIIEKYKPKVNRLRNRNKLIDKSEIIEYNAFLFFVHFIMLNKDEYILNYNNKDIIEILKSIDNNKNIFEFLDDYEMELRHNEDFEDFYRLFNELYSEIKYLKSLQNNFIQNNQSREFIINYSLENEKAINEILLNTQHITAFSSEDAFYCDFIDYRFLNIEKNIYFLDLSEGEKDIFRICIDFLHHLDLGKEKNIIFLFDEIDNFMHPIWKREILHILVELIDEFIQMMDVYCKYNLVLTTHSPFILSDLPKDNVIFLEKGEQVYPFKDKQTFGANIHTLLSHGFFMKDGLMGEFAKEKINEVIAFLNYGKETEQIKSNEDAQKYINIIGEPILKRQLQKMLDSKRLSKIDEIYLLKQRIEELENKQK